MNMDITPRSAAAVTALLSMRHGGLPEPLDCSTPILDLCVRPRQRSTTPEGANHMMKSRTPPREPPSSTRGYSSPGSLTGSENSEISTSSDPFTSQTHSSIVQTPIKPTAKLPRPFKVYPRDPLALTAGATATDALLSQNSAGAYAEFRQRMLSQVNQNQTTTNKNMRRNTQTIPSSQHHDPNYWEKRRKNNEAAKRSRDARRAKEDEIAIRAAFLEQENLKLKYENVTLRNELERLSAILYH